MAKKWYRCEVEKAGAADDGKIYVSLKGLLELSGMPRGGTGFPSRWFCAPESGKKEMLAIALTAITSRLLVDAEFEMPLGENTIICRLNLLNKDD